jgi:1,4-alpha-glucan branching enzyme
MGWMHDTIDYVKQDPVFRRYHHRLLTFSLLYAFSENYILPFSHDEVVHMKGSMWGKASGDPWQKAATLRLLYGYMYSHPGKKLTFMGAEFGQVREWSHDRSLDWHLLDDPLHGGLQAFMRDLNQAYASEPALHQCDFDPAGFQWIDCNDSDNSVVSLIRRATNHEDFVIAIFNFTPVPRHGYVIGVPPAGSYDEVINSDAGAYGGSNLGNDGTVIPEPIAAHGYGQSLRMTLPPLAFLLLKPSGASPRSS